MLVLQRADPAIRDRTVVIGESRTFSGGVEWLRSNGVRVVDLDSDECRTLMESFIREHPAIWHEDIGEI